MGEYEACIEARRVLDENWSDWELWVPESGEERLYDEYGREYWSISSKGTDFQLEHNIEYDDDGRMVKITTIEGDGETSTLIYEYDDEGRVSRMFRSFFGKDSESTNVSTYAYTQNGFTEYWDSTFRFMDNPVEHKTGAVDCEFVNEYGEYIQGEAYNTSYEEY